MSDGDELPFLSRWSRRKLEAKEAEPAAEPAPAVLPAADAGAVGLPVVGSPAAAAASPASPAPLPSVDTLQGVASEYKEFLKPGVDETVKRAALKKLFNDPHFGFANMDKLDIYIDDYSIEDPIPEAMLRSLNQSKSLFLFEEKKEEGERAVQVAQPGAETAPTAAVAPPDELCASLEETGVKPADGLSQPLETAAKQPDPPKPA